MGISSPGIGSGLDVKSIVSQLVALEKQPIAQLQTAASSLSAKLSAFGQIKSQMANLQDMADKLAADSNWTAMTVSSSNSAAVSGTATAAAAPTAFSVSVSQLARAQAAGSAVISPAGSAVGEGSLSIQLGSWSASGAGTFTAGAAAAVKITVSSTDTLSQIAEKINSAKAGVTATVLKDSSGERLLMRSSATGEASGFRIQASDVDGVAINNGTALGRLAYDPANVTSGGMSLTQSALNTLATINGVAVSSQNNALSDTISGLSLTVSQVTTAPVDVTVARDTSAARNSVNNFVSSYNAISNALAEMTKYVPSTKTAGTLQGDSTALSLQAALRRLVGGTVSAGGNFSRLSDLGVEFQSDGTLKVNDTKLTSALAKPDDVKAFFTANNGASATNGLALRIRDFASGLLAVGGTITTKTSSLQSAIDRNTKEQQAVSDRADRAQARLTAQYSRLDTSLSKLTALSTYVSQQVTTWNKSTG